MICCELIRCRFERSAACVVGVLLAGTAMTSVIARLTRPTLPPGVVPVRSVVVAHAGGAVNGVTYTNSREALDTNYAGGQRWFELDFSWTSDGELVAVHDWEWAWPARFIDASGVPTRAGFQAAVMRHGLQQMTLDDVVAWLQTHPDAVVITDLKLRNTEGLSLIRQRAGACWSQFVPQIYGPDEYAEVHSLGGAHPPILTLYQSKLSDDGVIRFVEAHKLFAVTMPASRARSGDLASRLRAGGIFVYAHTVNDVSELASLAAAGTGGVYSDHLGAATVREGLRGDEGTRFPARTESLQLERESSDR